MLKHASFALSLPSGCPLRGQGSYRETGEFMPVLTKRVVDAAAPRETEYQVFE